MVTTLDYNPIYSSHPQIRTINLEDLKKLVRLWGPSWTLGKMPDTIISLWPLSKERLIRVLTKAQF